MYDSSSNRNLRKQLERYTGYNQAQSISTYLYNVGIESLADAASHSDAGLLKIRGIGQKSVDTIRLAHECESDPDLRRQHRIAQLKEHATGLEKEIADLKGQLVEVNEQIDWLTIDGMKRA